jgi:hypothetical protein
MKSANKESAAGTRHRIGGATHEQPAAPAQDCPVAAVQGTPLQQSASWVQVCP